MKTTVHGMLRNFYDLVDQLGYVPNGGRIYYDLRSQPPMLTAMTALYVNKTADTSVLQYALPRLEREYAFWMTERNITINCMRWRPSLMSQTGAARTFSTNTAST